MNPASALIRALFALLLLVLTGMAVAAAPSVSLTTLWADDQEGEADSKAWVGWTEGGKTSTEWLPHDEAVALGLPVRPSVNQDLVQSLAKGVRIPTAPSQIDWAVLRCAFPGSPSFPQSLAHFRRVLEKPQVGVFSYFNRQSDGRLGQTVAWTEEVTLPLTTSGYWQVAQHTPGFLERTTADCLAAAANKGRDLQSVTGVMVLFNDVIDCCAYGSGYTMPGSTRRVAGVWLPPWASADPAVVAHEVAHSLGVPHSNNSDRDGDRSDNLWDPMSNVYNNRGFDAEIGGLPKSLHAFHRQELGWLAPEQAANLDFVDATHQSTQVTLGEGGLSLLRIRTRAGEELTVVFRGAGTTDDGLRTEPAVFLDDLVVNRIEPLWVIDATTPTPTTASSASSYFTAGERWARTIDSGDLTIVVKTVSTTTATVEIHLGPTPEIFSDTFE